MNTFHDLNQGINYTFIYSEDQSVVKKKKKQASGKRCRFVSFEERPADVLFDLLDKRVPICLEHVGRFGVQRIVEVDQILEMRKRVEKQIKSGHVYAMHA